MSEQQILMAIHDAIRACDQIRTPCGISGTIRKVLDELMRMIDDTPATPEWAISVLLTGYLWCDSENEWFIGGENIGELSRGQVRRIASGLCIPIEENATNDA